MKTLLGLAVLALTVNASADQWTTVKKDLSQKNYESVFTYPVFNDTAKATAFAKINKGIEDTLVSGGCEDLTEATETLPYSSNASARVVALNSNYVGIEVTYDNYCGGAYPNYGKTYLTFDAQTGAQSDLSKEVPGLVYPSYPEIAYPEEPVAPTKPTATDAAAQAEYQAALATYNAAVAKYKVDKAAYDKAMEKHEVLFAQFNKVQIALAEVLYAELKANPPVYGDDEGDCYTAGTKEEGIDNIVLHWPSISGLAANKKVILSTNPAHVAGVCAVNIRVSYDKVEKFISKSGSWAAWLK